MNCSCLLILLLLFGGNNCGISCCNRNDNDHHHDDHHHCHDDHRPVPLPTPCGCDDDMMQPRGFSGFPNVGTCGCEEKKD